MAKKQTPAEIKNPELMTDSQKKRLDKVSSRIDANNEQLQVWQSVLQQEQDNDMLKVAVQTTEVVKALEDRGMYLSRKLEEVITSINEENVTPASSSTSSVVCGLAKSLAYVEDDEDISDDEDEGTEAEGESVQGAGQATLTMSEYDDMLDKLLDRPFNMYIEAKESKGDVVNGRTMVLKWKSGVGTKVTIKTEPEEAKDVIPVSSVVIENLNENKTIGTAMEKFFKSIGIRASVTNTAVQSVLSIEEEEELNKLADEQELTTMANEEEPINSIPDESEPVLTLDDDEDELGTSENDDYIPTKEDVEETSTDEPVEIQPSMTLDDALKIPDETVDKLAHGVD